MFETTCICDLILEAMHEVELSAEIVVWRKRWNVLRNVRIEPWFIRFSTSIVSQRVVCT